MKKEEADVASAGPTNNPDLDVTASAPAEQDEDSDDGRSGAGRKSASTVLVEMAQERYSFGVSDAGETYAVPRGDAKVILMLRGGKTSLRGQLSRAYFTRTRRTAAQQALADALLVIEGVAQESKEDRLYLRVANDDGSLWLDLGDITGRAVQVTAAGWTVQDNAPVLFKRTALNGPLPEPRRGGSLDDLWRLLNVTTADRPLVAAWLVAVLFCDIPHPVLGLFGEQGTGKSTAGKLLVLILDPSGVPARKPPRDADSWVTAASGSWVVGLDNLSDIAPWLSDSLCRAVTGDGDVRRKLYTDGDFAVFAFRRAILVNGIDVGAMRGDLAERMLAIDLDRIPDDKRRDEAEMWGDWPNAHPLILGAVLDLAAGVMRVMPSVRLESKPRMADFARILAAVDKVLGTEGLTRYCSRAVNLAADGLSADPFVIRMLEAIREGFTGTAASLLALVEPADDRWRAPKGWPGDSRKVTAHLRRLAPALRKTGWTVTDLGPDNHLKVVRWQITPPADADADAPSETARTGPRERPQPPQPAGYAGSGGGQYGPSQGDDRRWLISGQPLATRPAVPE
jgi:hypothetical protein